MDLDTATASKQSSDHQSQSRRAWVSGCLGTALEMYDFLIYSTAAAIVFGTLFFPTFSTASGVVASFATLAAGYIARPLGAIIFGHYGDKLSRKSSLIVTLGLMGVATALIGVLPTHDQIGIAAPILLTTLRLVQGIAAGGEWGGAVLMSVEHGRTERRGLQGSSAMVGTNIGAVLAFSTFGVVTALTGESFLEWGWRIPFLLSVLLLGVGMYLRLRVEETPVLLTEQAKVQDESASRSRIPISQLFRRHSGKVLLAVGIGIGPYTVSTLLGTFVLSYSISNFGVDRTYALGMMAAASLIGALTIPIFAVLSDRFGRRPLSLLSAVLLMVFSFVVFPLMQTGQVFWTFAIGYSVFSMASGCFGALLSELFPTKVRYTGVGLSYQIVAVLGGGLGPLIASSLLTTDFGLPAVAAYMAAGCLVSVISLAFYRETRSVDLVAV